MLAWNERCRFPRDDGEIEKAVTNAYSYARDEEPGTAAAPPAREAFASLMKAQVEAPPASPVEAANRTFRSAGLRLEVLGLDAALGEPEPEWFVKGALPAKGLCMIYGPPKRGKTTATLDLALSCAAARPWLGAWPILLPGPVIYVALEGYPDLIGRVRSWQEHHGKVPDGSFHVLRGSLPIGDVEAVDALIEGLRTVCPHPSLIVFDTHAKAMLASGLEENDARDQGLAAAAMERIGEEFSCTVVGIAHTGKDVGLGMRGSNALLGAAEAAISADMKEGTLSIKVEEIRRGAAGAVLQARVVGGPDEYPVWQAAESPLVADPISAGRRQVMRARSLLVAICRAATSGSDAEYVSRPEFCRRVHAFLPENSTTLERVRREVERVLDANQVLRDRLLAPGGRIAVVTRAGRSDLFAAARISQEETDVE